MVGRGEKTYFAAPAQALLGGMSYWDDRPSKRGRKECYGGLKNETNLPLSGKGECYTPLVVSKYA